MSEHVNGTHRDQTVLFPNTIDQYVEKENAVRFIDDFVDSLNLEKLGQTLNPS
jgi:transposase